MVRRSLGRLHPHQVTEWNKQLLERAAEVFEGSWYKDDLPAVCTPHPNSPASSGATESSTVCSDRL